MDDDPDHLYFDYIMKMDTDVVLYPSRLFSGLRSLEIPSPAGKNLIYGGVDAGIGNGSHGRKYLRWPRFMLGYFYFMSVELARHVATVDHEVVESYKATEEYKKKFSPSNVREKKKGMGEDVSMSNIVQSHPKRDEVKLISLRSLTKNLKFQIHPFKEPAQFLQYYRKNAPPPPKLSNST